MTRQHFTVLPCGLKIRRDGVFLELRGDWGAPGGSWEVPSNYGEGDTFLSFDQVKLAIAAGSENLRGIAAFFAKEAARMEKEESNAQL